MYNGAGDIESYNPKEEERHIQRVKEEMQKFTEVQLRFLTFEEKNKNRIQADKEKRIAEKNKTIQKYLTSFGCCSF